MPIEQQLPFPLPRNSPPPPEKALQFLQILGCVVDSKNGLWQARTICVLADGSREHYLSYVSRAGGTYRDGIRTEKIGQALYEMTGLLSDKQEGMDREYLRDYVIKPLLELGVVIEATWERREPRPVLLRGHIRAKSANSVYRLSDRAVVVVDATPESRFIELARAMAERLPEHRLERAALQEAMLGVQESSPHGALLQQCVDVVRHYLPDFKPVFIDLSDGTRISDVDLGALSEHGLALTLKDNLPDAILASRRRRLIIGIEAVTSDGEFDRHRVTRLQRWATRYGYELAAAVTAFRTYRDFGRRQSSQKNISAETFVWIAEEPEVLFWKDLAKVGLESLIMEEPPRIE